MEAKFKRGDIITRKGHGNNPWIIAYANSNYEFYLGFSDNNTYSIDFEEQDKFEKIGEFPLQPIKDAIDNAKRQSMDLQTQVNIAVHLMGQLLGEDGGLLLVLTDMRVDKDKNIVFVRCSDGIGRPDKWVSIVQLCEDYGVNTDGVR